MVFPDMGTNLLTAGQVAAKAGVHRTTVHHWERDGKLEAATVVNGIRLFAVETVDQFLAERNAEPTEAVG
jgi:DNA-binding transcriptional MerR regulator